LGFIVEDVEPILADLRLTLAMPQVKLTEISPSSNVSASIPPASALVTTLF
jgi:hypothetical protein